MFEGLRQTTPLSFCSRYPFLSVCLVVCLSVSLSVCLSVSPSLCLSLSFRSRYPFLFVSVCLSVSLCLRLSICLSVSLSLSLFLSLSLSLCPPSYSRPAFYSLPLSCLCVCIAASHEAVPPHAMVPLCSLPPARRRGRLSRQIKVIVAVYDYQLFVCRYCLPGSACMACHADFLTRARARSQ